MPGVYSIAELLAQPKGDPGISPVILMKEKVNLV